MTDPTPIVVGLTLLALSGTMLAANPLARRRRPQPVRTRAVTSGRKSGRVSVR